LYLFRLLRAFYRLSKAFWQQRRSNFIGAVIIFATVGALFGAELYADARWLLTNREFLTVNSGEALSEQAKTLQRLPAQTMNFLGEVGWDARGNLHEFAALAADETFPNTSERNAKPGRIIAWPAWTEPDIATPSAGGVAPRRNPSATPAVTPSEPEEVAATPPVPPKGNGRFYWVTAPKVLPNKSLPYGPAPVAAAREEELSSGALRSRRSNSMATLAANEDD
jgi:hypothetical protein